MKQADYIKQIAKFALANDNARLRDLLYQYVEYSQQNILLMIGAHRFQKSILEFNHFIQRYIMQQAMYPAIKDGNLLAHRHRAVLGLNQ